MQHSDQTLGSLKTYSPVDTRPAQIPILVYHNGDHFYLGKKFFEVLLEQLTQQLEVPFRVWHLYTPLRGHQVLELEALKRAGVSVPSTPPQFSGFPTLQSQLVSAVCAEIPVHLSKHTCLPGKER